MKRKRRAMLSSILLASSVTPRSGGNTITHHLRKLFSVVVLCALLLAPCRPTAKPTPTSRASDPTGTASATRTSPGGTAQATAPATTAGSGRSAEINEIQGTADKRESDKADWSEGAIGDTLAAGHQVRTGAESLATLRFTEGTIVRVAPDSLFTLAEVGGDTQNPITRIELAVGKLFALLLGTTGEGEFEIETPSGVASVRGSLLSVQVTDDGRIVITCLETSGGCHLENAGGSVDLASGQQAEIVGAETPPTAAEKIDDSELNAWFQTNPEAQAVVVEDEDKDTYPILAGDCDDHAPAIHPGAEEIADDGTDQNCDGADGFQPDGDGDGFTPFEGDCNDEDPAIHPGADDRSGDRVDQNCDGLDGVGDRDKDDLPDEFDLCPDDPGPFETFGCPPAYGGDDGDKDGVPDPFDECPNDPGLPDNRGCPPGEGHDDDEDGFSPGFGDCDDG